MLRAWFAATFAVAVLVSACGGEDVGPSEGDGGTGGSGGTGGTGGVGDGGSGGAGGGDGTARCGNGIVEGDEACDDGEGVNSDTRPDACRTDCTLPRCGDGVVDSGESCDDGNTDDGDGCSASCQLEGSCGDGVAGGAEACDGDDLRGTTCADLGYDAGTLACDASCGFDESGCTREETCDNGIDDDENGLVDCEDPACAALCPRCGDGVRNQESEACDGADIPVTCGALGWASGTVGCDDACQLVTTACRMAEDCATDEDEDGDGLAGCADPDCFGHWECPQCGDGIPQRGEACDGGPPAGITCADYGFNSGTPGCDASCQASSVGCYDVEQCDNGVDDTGNGLIDCADPACFQVAPCPVCGNGVREEGEACDDANVADGDGCSASCELEELRLPGVGNTLVLRGDVTTDDPTYVRPEPDCTFNGWEGEWHYTERHFVNRDETALWVDMSGTWMPEGFLHVATRPFDPDSLDGCLASHGDYWAPTSSQIENLEVLPGQAIAAVITTLHPYQGLPLWHLEVTTVARCGDRVVGGGETCDDGNDQAGDGCHLCRVEPGWVCDDAGCRETVCGDGEVEGDEQCDDGNDELGDGCTPDCRLEGDDCDAPLVIDEAVFDGNRTWRVFGDTTPYSPRFSLGCAPSSGNRDVVYRFTAPEAGAYLFDLDGIFGAVLAVWDGVCEAQAPVLACTDWPTTAGIDLAAGQTIYVVVDGYGAGPDVSYGFFTLRIRQMPTGQLAESEPNDQRERALVLPPNTLGRGAIHPATDEDWWSFEAEAFRFYRIATLGAPNGSCSDTAADDTAIEVYDAGGMLEVWDDDEGGGRCAKVTYFATSAGLHHVRVTAGSLGAEVPAYYLSIEPQ